MNAARLMKCRLAGTLALAFGLGWSPLAQAQWKPDNPVRLIVPFGPGGGTDLLARSVAVELRKSLGQPVLVENRPGGNGWIGANAVAKASPDGLMLCVCSTGQTSTAGLLGEQPPYNPLKDLVPVSGGWSTTVLLAVRNGLPVSSMAELIAYAKSTPQKLSFGNVGIGSPNHLGGELLSYLAKIELLQVPYKGESDAITALASGTIDIYAPTTSSNAPALIRDGRIKAIAVFTSERLPAFPGLLPVREQGYSEFSMDPITGFYVPAGTPAVIIDTLSKAIQDALKSSGIRESVEKAGARPLIYDASTFRQLVIADRDKWFRLKDAGAIKLTQ